MTELPDDIIELQRLAFRYFVDHTNGKNGLVADNTRENSPCSIAATGLGLSCHPIAVANGWLKRADAAERVLTALRFFDHSPQGPEPDVTGYKGFYYHFLEMKGGRRAGMCELSTVDSASFAQGWDIESIEPTRVETRPDLEEFTFSEGGPKAWFAVIRRAS